MPDPEIAGDGDAPGAGLISRSGMLPDDYDLPAYAGPTVEFVIRYHPETHEDTALQLARRLFAELDFRIGSLTLVPDSSVDLNVWLGDELVYSQVGRSAEPSARQIVDQAWRLLKARESK